MCWILCCDWCALHSTGDKLLYGHVPDPFPPWWMGSGHVRLCQSILNIEFTASLLLYPANAVSPNSSLYSICTRTKKCAQMLPDASVRARDRFRLCALEIWITSRSPLVPVSQDILSPGKLLRWRNFLGYMVALVYNSDYISWELLQLPRKICRMQAIWVSGDNAGTA